MKFTILKLLILLFIPFSTHTQTQFYDGFETGDFSKWDNVVGASISTAYHHSGNYSAKLDLSSGENTKKLVKNFYENNYIKIDLFVNITSWYTGNPTNFNIGANGLLWEWFFYEPTGSYIFNCTHQNIGGNSCYLPMNQWNHVILEKTSSGFLNGWINGGLFIDGISVGSCHNTDATIACNVSPNFGYITAYIDDVTITYVPIGVIQISYQVPKYFLLSQNYPNPFNPTTKIKFDIPKTSFTKLIIYDQLGKEIATLVNEELKAGTYQVYWNGSNYSSGVYFYKIQAGDFVETKKMVLIR